MTFQPVIKSFEEFEAETRELVRRPSKFGRLRWRDLDKPGAEHSYVVDGLISDGDKMIIGGPSMSGKSFFSIHVGLTVALAASTPDLTVFGQKILKPGLVIYQAGEGARGVKKRMRAWRRHFNVPRDIDLPFELLQSRVDLYAADGDTAALIEEIKSICEDYPDIPLVMVVIDTLATATGSADENSGKDMSAVMINIDKIRNATGANVCLVHHVNAAGTKLRGHSSILANIDQVIMVSKDEKTGVRTAYLGKQKDDADDLKFKFELMQVETGRVRALDGKLETSCVCLELGEKEIVRKAEAAKGFRLRPQEEVIFRALWEARRKGGAIATDEQEKTFNVKPGTILVHYNDWREAFAAAAAPGENGERPTPDATRQHFKRHHAGMVKFDVIGLNTPFMWWTGKPVRDFPETHRTDSEQTDGGQMPDIWPTTGDEAPF